jgi:HlyD family secretion protein
MAQAMPRPIGPRPVVDFPSRRAPRWRWIAPGAVLLLFLVLAFLYMTGQLATLQRRLLGQSIAVTYQTATVSKGTVAETVTATGPVAAAQTLPLSFKSSGKLADLKVSVGQTVKKGDVLAQIDPTDLQAALDQAKANLQQAEAAFAKAQRGATPEEVQAAAVALRNAQQAAADAASSAAASQASAAKDVEAAQASAATSQNSLKAAQDALAAARDQAAKKIAADQVAVDNAQKALDAAKNLVATSPAILKQQLEKAKDDLWAAQISRDATCGRDRGAGCASANATVAGLETAVNNFSATAAQTAKQNEQTIQTAQNALETAKATLASDQATQAAAIKTAENNVKAAEAAVNTAQTSIAQAQAKAASTAQSAKQSANTAAAQVKTAEASLATTSAPPTKADIDSAAAAVANARVAVKTAENNLAGATLTAPIDGTVTAISGTVGQWITGGAVTTNATSATGGIITLATLDDLQVTANVNEADVGKVKLCDPVSFTIAAFPGKTFAGEVTQIQPTGVTTSNVVTYAITSSIKSVQGATLYPGMTATVTVTTAEQKDALLVSNSALTYAKSRGESQGVVVLENGKPIPVKVTTGLSDGTNTAVTGGLQEGQVVVTGQGGGTASDRTTTGTGSGATNRAATQSSNPLTGGGPPPGVKGG